MRSKMQVIHTLQQERSRCIVILIFALFFNSWRLELMRPTEIVSMPSKRPPLTVAQILAWAEAHVRRTGKRPNGHSGPIPESAGETWSAIDTALIYGYRGLPGGLSLAEFLNQHWGEKPPNDRNRPPLTLSQILAWAKSHYQRAGKWPTAASGEVPEAPQETWKIINSALWEGHRGLPGGDSLSRLLRRSFGESASAS